MTPMADPLANENTRRVEETKHLRDPLVGTKVRVSGTAERDGEYEVLSVRRDPEGRILELRLPDVAYEDLVKRAAGS